MNLDKLFHAYDIRGVYPDNLNNEFAYQLGNAFGVFLKHEFEEKQDFLIVIGRDGRESSLPLFKNFTKGVTNQGVDVLNIGELPTDVLYFALNFLKTDGGVMITGSHNPKGYNGFKIALKGPKFLSGKSGLPELKELCKKNFKNKKEKGAVKDYEIMEEYRSYILSLVNVDLLDKKQVVIDGAGGVGGKVIKSLKGHVPINLNCIFCDVDRDFSEHSPNPIIFENIKNLSKKVKVSKADFGLALDGDGDRIVFVDEKGEPVEADITLALFAKHFLKKEPGATIVYNLTCSKIVPEVIKENGGKPVEIRTGSTFLKETSKRENAILGGEISAHLCYRDVYFSESAIFSLLIMLEILSHKDKPLSELVKPFQKYHRMNETNFKVNDREKVIQSLSKHFDDGKEDWLDGLTVEFDNWWFNARPSNTEPLLRVVVEANTKKQAQAKLAKIKKIINKVK